MSSAPWLVKKSGAFMVKTYVPSFVSRIRLGSNDLGATDHLEPLKRSLNPSIGIRPAQSGLLDEESGLLQSI
jgi:hypothetical protein